jgi:hypothetical protein
MTLFRVFLGGAALVYSLAFSPRIIASEPATPGPGFTGERYASLWTKSPFAIATPDAPAATTDYALVGIAQFDGVSYASLIEKQSQEHFVISSDKPYKNLKLVWISRGKGDDATSAVVDRNGESLTLTLEQTASASPMPGSAINLPPGTAAGNPSVGGVPGGAFSGANLPPGMPAGNPSVGGMPATYLTPPAVRIHRPRINIPPPPPQ